MKKGAARTGLISTRTVSKDDKGISLWSFHLSLIVPYVNGYPTTPPPKIQKQIHLIKVTRRAMTLPLSQNREKVEGRRNVVPLLFHECKENTRANSVTAICQKRDTADA